MNIVFFGASRYVIPVIAMLQKHFNLALVVTTERNPLDTVPDYCQKNGIPYCSVKKFSDAEAALRETNPTLGVLASFGILLPKDALKLFPKGILNIHPSLLPHYRGAMPVQSAILHGDHETGVTIIKLDEQMDHGDILAQEKEIADSSETSEQLYTKLFIKGAELLQHHIPDYVNGKISLKAQQHNQATYTKRSLSKQDGYIDMDNAPDPVTLDRMIRAYYPWPTVWTKLVIKEQEKIVKFLPGKKVQVEGKKPMSLKDFFNGYPELKETLERVMQ